MAFIGNQPTAVPLTSSQLADGLITTAKLAADAVTSAKIADGAIVNVDVNSTAALAYSKLNLATSIVNADINASAAIATTKLGAGAVLQVITATDNTVRTTTSTTYVTGSNTLSVAITPSSASNKVLILCSSSIQNASAGAETNVTIYRDSTNLAGTRSFTYGYHVSAYESNSLGISYLDSPNTTSAITYQVYFRTTSGGTAQINVGNIGNTGSITCLEIKG